MSKRRRDAASTLLDVLNEDEDLTTFHKLLLNKFDSIISFLQRIDEKVYSIDKRLSYLENKDKEPKVKERESNSLTKEIEKTDDTPEKESTSSESPPAPIPRPPSVAVTAPTPPTAIAAVEQYKEEEQEQPVPTTSNTIAIKEELDDDESSQSQSILEIEDLQNLAAKSEAIEIEDVSFILPNEAALNEGSCTSFSQPETLDNSAQGFPQGSFNCLDQNFNKKTRSFPCVICSKMFSRSSNRNRHERSVHRFDSQKNCVDEEISVEKTNLFLCYICQKTFNRSFNLHRHILTHAETERRRIKCRFKSEESVVSFKSVGKVQIDGDVESNVKFELEESEKKKRGARSEDDSKVNEQHQKTESFIKQEPEFDC